MIMNDNQGKSTSWNKMFSDFDKEIADIEKEEEKLAEECRKTQIYNRMVELFGDETDNGVLEGKCQELLSYLREANSRLGADMTYCSDSIPELDDQDFLLFWVLQPVDSPDGKEKVAYQLGSNKPFGTVSYHDDKTGFDFRVSTQNIILKNWDAVEDSLFNDIKRRLDSLIKTKKQHLNEHKGIQNKER